MRLLLVSSCGAGTTSSGDGECCEVLAKLRDKPVSRQSLTDASHSVCAMSARKRAKSAASLMSSGGAAFALTSQAMML